jgi:hypothetical protein
MTSPYQDEQFADHTAPIPFQAYVTSLDDSIEVFCLDQHNITGSGGYPVVAVTTLKYAGGSYSSHGQTVYPVQATAPVPDLCWLDRLGDRVDPPHEWFAFIQLRYVTPTGSSTTAALFFDAEGLSCLGSHLVTEGPITAGMACGLRNSGGYVHGITIRSSVPVMP